MTRETKIGLLVGLAFIIVIGILLSDHLTTATEPPQAYLPQVGPNVRQGVTIPGTGQQPSAAANPGVTVAPPVVPPQPVPTVQDLAPRPQPVQIVQIGPSDNPQQQPPQPSQSQPQQAAPPSAPPPVTFPPTAAAQTQVPPTTVVPPAEPAQPTEPVAAAQQEPAVITTPAASGGDAGVLEAIARQYGEPVVGTDAPRGQPTQVAQAEPADETAPLPAGAKQYKAVAGDSLSKIAAKVYGTSSKAMQDAIAKANPSLRKDPNLIIAGRTYVIPAVSGSGTIMITSAAPNPAPATAARRQVAAQPEYFYTVKTGDTLWQIAAEQVGNPNAVAAIKDLNRDLLKGTDNVRPNMKLRLPAKPVASAN